MLVAVQRRESNEAAPVMDNTPPTTPDSDISNVSGSPRDERTGGSTPSSSEDNSKLDRDSSEAENDGGGKGPSKEALTKPENGGHSGAVSSSSVDRIPKPPAKRAIGEGENASPKKRKKRKDQDGSLSTNQTNNGNNSGKRSPRQSARNARHGTGSDSDDTSEGSNQCINNSTQANNNLTRSEVSPGAARNMINDRPSTDATMYMKPPSSTTKYNFIVDLGK